MPAPTIAPTPIAATDHTFIEWSASFFPGGLDPECFSRGVLVVAFVMLSEGGAKCDLRRNVGGRIASRYGKLRASNKAHMPRKVILNRWCHRRLIAAGRLCIHRVAKCVSALDAATVRQILYKIEGQNPSLSQAISTTETKNPGKPWRSMTNKSLHRTVSADAM
jgi:hypothetical protein